MKKHSILTFLLLAVIIISGCSSLPSPKGEKDKLVIISSVGIEDKAVLFFQIDHQGKTNIRKSSLQLDLLSDESRGYFTLAIKEGQSLELLKIEIPGEVPLEIHEKLDLEEKSVCLFNHQIEKLDGHLLLAPITPETQRFTSDYLTSYIDYFVWGGRKLVGFGPYEPRLIEKDLYEVDFHPDRGNLELWIDQVNWGTPPLKASLDAGKHQIRYLENGTELLRTFIDVQNDMKIEHRISPVDSTETKPLAQDQYILTMGFIENLSGEEKNYLIPLLTGSLRIQLDGNDRLIITEGENHSLEDAETAGSEFLLQGSFIVVEQDIMIHLLLRDVQTGRILTGTQQVDILGLDIIKMMQESADEFSRGVLRQLPPLGENYFIQKVHFTENILQFEGDFAKKNTLQNRIKEHPWAISLGMNLGIIGLESEEKGASGEGVPMLSGDPIPFPGIEVERYLGQSFLLVDQFRFRLFSSTFDKPATDESGNVVVEPYHFFSNSLALHYLVNRSVNSEFSFLLAEDTLYRSATRDNYGQEYGPQLNFTLATGLRYRQYLQNRLEEESHWPYMGLEFQYYLKDVSYYPQSNSWASQNKMGNILHLFIGRRF